MSMDRDEFYSSLYLAHHGVKGQRWGTRRYQNEDGSYKSGAEGRYDPEPSGNHHKPTRKEFKAEYKAAKKEYKADKKAERNAKIKKAIGYGLAGAAVAGVAAYGISKAMKSGAARIAAAEGMKQYGKLIDDGVINLREGLSKSDAMMNRGKAVYDQITNGGASTKAATRSVLQYLGTGQSMKSLPSADSLGRVQSTGELALKAVGAQTKRVAGEAGSKLKDAAGNAKDKISEAIKNRQSSGNLKDKISKGYGDYIEKVTDSLVRKPLEKKRALHSVFDDPIYLAHHGIKGQRWGVRRYQNEDGSYTDEGAKRRRVGDSSGGSSSDKLKKAAKIGAAVAGAALVTYGAYKLYQMNQPVSDFTLYGLSQKLPSEKRSIGTIAKDTASKIAGKVRESGIKDKLKESSKKALKETGEFAKKSVKKAGEAAASAALASLGTIAASKLAEQYKDKADDDEQTRNANLIKREAMTAAARSVASSASAKVSGSSGNNKGQRSASGKEFTDMVHNIVGTPNRKHDWNGDYQTRYQNLMNGPLRDNETLKADVKMMRHLEYSIDQMEEYVKAKS